MPRLIYVTDGDPIIHVQTQMLSVWVRDETGGDALGSDELMVWFGGISSIPHWDEIEDIEGGFGYFSWNDADTGEYNRARRLVSSVKISLGADDRAQLVLRAAEDDDFDFEHVVAGAVGAVVGAVGGYFAGGPYGAIAGGAAGGFGAFTAMLAISSPDDEIGQAAWQASLIDIQSRALLARDNQISAGPFPTPARIPSCSRALAISDSTSPSYGAIQVSIRVPTLRRTGTMIRFGTAV